ncbi:unnamed protein product [Protopolystoma xenopodis]|uniref:Uncharacterized protein n=1 Tax=Protopolystoma xenopodis TaxID=117903 RepID=A0A448XET7_9PLAT|nr:unnamed protein product [Protopolystoma xenopodis]
MAKHLRRSMKPNFCVNSLFACTMHQLETSVPHKHQLGFTEGTVEKRFQAQVGVNSVTMPHSDLAPQFSIDMPVALCFIPSLSHICSQVWPPAPGSLHIPTAIWLKN